MNKMAYEHPHLGKMIREVMKRKRITQSELSRELGVNPSTVKHYLRQESITFRVLWKICIALEYDFLAELQKYFPPVMPPKDLSEEQERIKDLEKEISIYKKTLKIMD